ncbi:hypothetical protein B0H12DRAFT_1076629 [Mycena haematopus]|nr:hypothetical protein B0H12DRAFT_1076629 [Mycena haematopus]
MPADRTQRSRPAVASASTLLTRSTTEARPPCRTFLSTEIPSELCVRVSSGVIPVSPWIRVENDRMAFHGYLTKDRTTDADSPLPRPSFPEFPAALFPPPSTPAEMTQHKLRLMEEERSRRELNDRVTRAKIAAAADPTDKAKTVEYENLLDDYTTTFGDYIADAEVHAHILKKRQAMVTMDELWTAAWKRGCPISNPGPIKAYLDGAYDFHVDFKHPYQRDDGQTALFNLSCRVLERYNRLCDYCRGKPGELNRLVGQEEFFFTFVNPYALGDKRREELDAEMRQLVASYICSFAANTQETVHRRQVTFSVRNAHCNAPESVKCRRLYCGTRLLAEDLQALQKQAEQTAAHDCGLSATVSTATFYGVLDSLRL